MKVYMYDVAFGDCFLLKDKEESLLVDFGSDSKHQLDEIAEDIEKKVADKKHKRPLSALLTHFHTDHMNGFLKTNLADKVEIARLYIPNVVQMNASAGQISCARMKVLQAVFESVVINKKPEITLYSLLKKIMDDKSQVRTIHFLSRGSDFEVSGKSYKVLWPCFDGIKYNSRTESKVIDIAQWLGILKKDDHQTPDQEERPDFGVVDEFIESMVAVYRLLAGAEDITEIKQGDRLRTAMLGLDELYEQIAAITDAASKEMAQKGSQKVLKIKKTIRTLNDQNRESIVFHDVVLRGHATMLMTGDVVRSDFDKVIGNTLQPPIDLHEKYSYIKAPHHGTPTHYLSNMPNCSHILISNGEGNKQRGKISHCYGGFYSSNRKCRMLCTNPRCELIELSDVNKGAKCVNCESDQMRKATNGGLYLVLNV